MLVTGVLVTGAVLGGYLFWSADSGLPPEQTLRFAEIALAEERFDDAERIAELVDADAEQFAKSRLVAGESATRAGRLEKALEYYQQVPATSGADHLVAVYSQAEIYRTLSKWESAVDGYQSVLRDDPSFAPGHQRIAFVLGVSGQRSQAAPHLMSLVQLRKWDIDSLAILTDIERAIEQPELVAQSLSAEPSDPLVRLANANQRMIDGETDEAVAALDSLLASQPQMLAAHEMLGDALIQLSDGDRLMAWDRSLPAAAESSARVWFVRGQMARMATNLELAATCFVKALEIFPEYRQATYQLGQVLTKLNSPIAEKVMQRAQMQLEMSQQLDRILASEGRDVEAVKLVAQSCFALGRYWEAWAWAVTASNMHGATEWANEIISTAGAELESLPPRTLPSQTPIATFSLQAWNQPERWAAMQNQLDLPNSNVVQQVLPRTTNDAALFELEENVGIDFVYHNGHDPETIGVRMFEQTGGGVAAMDYDNDRWPDLYFTQGAPWKTGDEQPSPSPEYRDSLYRNIDGQQFRDVALQAHLEELQFGQGVSVGDFNHDGFQDLLVANVGATRLFANNGDGTFSEFTDRLEDQQPHWTTSCALVDLNGDGFEDIYQVNYVRGPGVYTLICNGKGCSPSVFQGDPNQCWLSDGQGGFDKLLRSDGEEASSKGLGVLALVLEGDRLPSLFIANDQVSNFLMSPQQTAEGDFYLEDDALIRGLALSMEGLAFACMGVAAGDIDNNGTTDLLVTNFANEPNSVYLQDQAGLFSDASAASGMQAASYDYVGWGTQFLDVERDGLLDAVVVYGHVDDYTDAGAGYAMTPQFFRNSGRARLELIPPKQSGTFFEQQFVARSLTRLDWNRDGRDDFAVSNINSPARLVSNANEQLGNFLNVRLVGTRSCRQPIGTVVTIEAGENRWVKQLTGGDGFQCSNEKMIQFGLADATHIDRVQIQWPSGAVEEYRDIAINHEALFVEGVAVDVVAL